MKTPWSFRGSFLPVLSALGIALAICSCSGKTTYGYADIHVTIDPITISRDVLPTIVTCDLQIVGTGINESRNLPCREGQIGYDLGTVEWTTDTSASLQFVVRLATFNRVLVGQGTSESVSVPTGKRTAVEVKVVAVSPPPGSDAATTTPQDGGASGDGGNSDAGDAAGADGAGDAAQAPANDSAVPASDGGPAG